MTESELEEGLKEAHYHWVLSEVVDLIEEYGHLKVWQETSQNNYLKGMHKDDCCCYNWSIDFNQNFIGVN